MRFFLLPQFFKFKILKDSGMSVKHIVDTPLPSTGLQSIRLLGLHFQLNADYDTSECHVPVMPKV